MASNATLIQSFVRRRWRVSTALRESTALDMVGVTYYETWACPQDPETGEMVLHGPDGEEAFQCQGTFTPERAMRQHLSVCRELAKKCPPCEADHCG